MESSRGAITPHSVVYCLDVDLSINRIAVSDFRVKFGIDYGQSVLKVIMTLTTASRNFSGISRGQEDHVIGSLPSPGN